MPGSTERDRVTALGSSRIEALLRAVEILHHDPSLERFPKSVFEVVERLFSSCYVTIQEFDRTTGQERHFANRPAPSGLLEQSAKLVPLEHPIFPVVMGGSFEAMRLSDFRTQRQLLRTALFNESFLPLGVRYQIVLPLRLPRHVAGVTLSRDRDFSDEELCLAQMLAPHLAQAHLHAQRVSALEKVKQGIPVLAESGVQTLDLTAREAETLHWIVLGKSDSEIAEIFGISVRTVEKHVENIFRKLGVENRTAAALHVVHTALERI